MVIPLYMMDHPTRDNNNNDEDSDDNEDYDAMLCGSFILWYYNKCILTTGSTT